MSLQELLDHMKQNYKMLVLSVFMLYATVFMHGCSGPAIGAGAGTGLAISASQDGGLGQAIEDFEIRAQVNDLWFRHSVDMYNALNLTIEEGRVLLTGRVQDPEMRVDAVRLTWQADGVKQVINEIRVEEGEGIVGYAKDTLIKTKLRARITFDKEISALNYTIDSVGGTVYLMGVAKDKIELQKVIDHARNIAHVREVVSYVRIREGQGAEKPVDETFEDVTGERYDTYYRIERPTIEQELEKR